MFRRQVHGTPNDQGNRDRARVHDKDVLDCQGHQLQEREAFVHRVNKVGHARVSYIVCY